MKVIKQYDFKENIDSMFSNEYHESLDGRAFEEDIKAFEEEFE